MRLFVSFLFFFNSLYAFKLGIENISDEFLRSLSPDKSLKYNVALVTNQTGCDQKGNRTVDILLSKRLQIKHIITSEHGFSGTVPANRRVGHEIDKKTKIPIYSLYKDGVMGTVPSDMAANIDVFFFDMQDSGMRHYTKITTLHKILRVASAHDKKVVVLDRPNPLGPNMEGPLVDPLLISSISIAPIPIRHGMTIGEIAWYFNKHVLDKPADLHVVKMENYSRDMKMKELLVALSPNVHCLESCLGYSFLGILGDIRPLDVGVDTDLSFQCITIPDTHPSVRCNWNQLRTIFTQYGVHSVPYSYMSDRKKNVHSGLRLQVADINSLPSFSLLLDIIDFFKKSGLNFTFSPTFDKAAGTLLLRKFCMGTCPRTKLVRNVNDGLDQFIKNARDAFMYLPEPQVVKLK
jgi:uncharacterized protein YbbC (DUF1343 family)